jgi:hypothetical protein
MISEALKRLESELLAYITTVTALPKLPATAVVKINNVAQIESADRANDFLDSLNITLVNIEEESSLKNGLHYRRTPIGGIEYENPPIYLNLYLLFTASFPSYENSLVGLGLIIRFFQGQNSFTLSTNEGELQMTLDLYTMTFEQVNHLWGSLGGKQMPFVMYKARLVRITDRKTQGIGTPIIEIQTEASPNL